LWTLDFSSPLNFGHRTLNLAANGRAPGITARQTLAGIRQGLQGVRRLETRALDGADARPDGRLRVAAVAPVARRLSSRGADRARSRLIAATARDDSRRLQ